MSKQRIKFSALPEGSTESEREHYRQLGEPPEEALPYIEQLEKKLQELTPEPKTIITLDTGHLSPKNVALIRQLVEISRKWLETKAHNEQNHSF